MFRALVELLVIIAISVIARAVLTSIFKGIANASQEAFRRQAGSNQNAGTRDGTVPPGPASGSELHKDPVCGTYVSESTAYRRNAGGQVFYYCSEACREKHALVTR